MNFILLCSTLAVKSHFIRIKNNLQFYCMHLPTEVNLITQWVLGKICDNNADKIKLTRLNWRNQQAMHITFSKISIIYFSEDNYGGSPAERHCQLFRGNDNSK